MVAIELKPGGDGIAVTEENKEEYVKLLVEHRIARRVREQFKAFMTGLNEIIPQHLIDVFDERELELLIGGISDIDVYVHLSIFRLSIYGSMTLTFLPNTGMTGVNTPTIVAMIQTTMSSNGSGNASEAGRLNANRAFFSLPQAHHGYLSMASKTCKDLMALGGSPLRNPVTLTRCLRAIRVSTGLIFHRIRITQHWNIS